MSSAVALITGASGGIGNAAARLLAKRGLTVVAHYNANREAAEALVADLGGAPHVAMGHDFSDAASVGGLVDNVVEHFGRIDVLVNNAGIVWHHNATDTEFDEWEQAWRKVIDTNLMAPAHLSFHAARWMSKQGGGRIVNVSSRGAFRGEPNQPAYGASKAGMNAMGQSMAQSLAPEKVYIYTVAPGFVETPMAESSLAGPGGDAIRGQSPFNRVAQPDEVANAIVYLATEAPAFMSGCIVDVNGASYLRS